MEAVKEGDVKDALSPKLRDTDPMQKNRRDPSWCCSCSCGLVFLTKIVSSVGNIRCRLVRKGDLIILFDLADSAGDDPPPFNCRSLLRGLSDLKGRLKLVGIGSMMQLVARRSTFMRCVKQLLYSNKH